MNVRLILIAVLTLLIVRTDLALAQGFAGLGTEADGFAAVEEGRQIVFPQDHGPHENYRIEWWYLTANLQDAEGNLYGVQWTLFRQSLTPGRKSAGWENDQIWMGHAALTQEYNHFVAELFARGGIGQAGVTVSPFQAWIDDWSLTSNASGQSDPFDRLTVTASGDDFAYRLNLTSESPLVLHGSEGYSRKSDRGQASYYYSAPFLTVGGSLTIDGKTIEVTGSAWLDREWSSQPLAEDQTGWDWFSLHLMDGEKVMLFRLRSEDGTPFYSGTWISADGTAQPLETDDVEFRPTNQTEVADRQVPTSWQLSVKSKNLNIETEPLNPSSWMATSFPYWEGPISFTGSHQGVGYLEMTGY